MYSQDAVKSSRSKMNKADLKDQRESIREVSWIRVEYPGSTSGRSGFISSARLCSSVLSGEEQQQVDGVR